MKNWTREDWKYYTKMMIVDMCYFIGIPLAITIAVANLF